MNLANKSLKITKDENSSNSKGNAKLVIPEPNVTNVTMDTLKDQMEVVKNVIVLLLDP